ncbi:auxin-responsive protein SAUR68-like [Durio zibethinus]|uniref:Auxin-responsive protein SAUR68-like n=1 Tax=Durio zibethinus TaxID=66656 RepID=A0A6P5XHA8_DURZI|nr:auxin-responsive protein SAUR68-like [Durio zibethinus]
MINTKKIIRKARKWQKKANIGRKIITASRLGNTMAIKKPSGVDKGHFVINTTNKRHFVIPLEYLSDSIFLQLLKMSEEEFGLSSDGPILLPCDSMLMNHVVLLIQRGLAKDLEKAMLNSLNTYRCSSCSTTFFHEGHADQQSLVCGF